MKPNNTYCLYLYEDAIKNVKIVNINQLDYYTYIRIPEYMNINQQLYSITEVNTSTLSEPVDLYAYIQRDYLRPWLKIQTDMFNLMVGFHMYKFAFVDTETNDTTCLYFIYHIQNDNPEKPYIYMNRDVDNDINKAIDSEVENS